MEHVKALRAAAFNGGYSRNPRAHGTREGSEEKAMTIEAHVAIHVLMEHVKARVILGILAYAEVAIHMLMEHMKAHKAQRPPRQATLESVAIHVLMEHMKAP